MSLFSERTNDLRRFHAFIIGHCLASYAALAAHAGFRWLCGEVLLRHRLDCHHVVVLVLYPVIQLFLVPYFLLGLPFHFDWELVVNLLTYATVITATMYLLTHRFYRHNRVEEVDSMSM